VYAYVVIVFLTQIEEIIHAIVDKKMSNDELIAAFNGEMADYYVVFAR
jgi:hypothetical protein